MRRTAALLALLVASVAFLAPSAAVAQARLTGGDLRGVPRQQVPEPGLQREAQPLDRIGHARDGGAHRRQVGVHAALGQIDEQRGLRRVPVVQAAGQRAGRLRDLPDGRGLEPLLAEQARGGIQEPVVDRCGSLLLGHVTKTLCREPRPVKQNRWLR